MHRAGSYLSFDVVRQHDVRRCVVTMSVVASSTSAAGRLPRVKLRRLRPATFSGFRGTRAAPVRAATTLARTLAATVASAAVLSGCQVMSPIQTTVPYQAANGVAVDLGAVQIRDLVVVSRAKGEVGTLSGMVVNTSAQPITISFAAGAAGDSVLKDLALVLNHSLREIDTAGRWGGEEFALILPGTDTAGGARLCERIRQTLADRRIPIEDGMAVSVTASFGVAGFAGAGSRERLLAAADEALYRAKRGGRNRVERAG